MTTEQTAEQATVYQAHQEVIEIMLNQTLDITAKTNQILNIVDRVAWAEAERGYDIGYTEAKHWYKLQ